MLNLIMQHYRTIFSRIATFTLLNLVVFVLNAQEKTSGATLTWEDLGFDGLPEGYSTEEIAMIEGLNKGRGSWAFEGSVLEAEHTHPIQGNLEINGSVKNGMLPMWGMTLSWPHNNAKYLIQYVLMVAPKRNQVGMSLFRMGPVKVGEDGKPTKEEMMKAKRIPFVGTWDLEQTKVRWKEKEMPGKAASKPKTSDPTKKESFDMVVGSNGEISIQNHKYASVGLVIAGKTTKRIGERIPEEKLAFNKDIHFAVFEDITESRIKKYIPSSATDITLRLQRGGHFARYKVSEKEFLSFLDTVWKGEERDEGSSVKKEVMMKRFGRLGWKPPENAISYDSPVKPNGAMSLYFFDLESEMVYEDTGYW